jgi:hypothetical protein
MDGGVDVKRGLEIKETCAKFEKCLWQARN